MSDIYNDMKRILQEDLRRIHRLNYKGEPINEQFDEFWEKLKEKLGVEKIDTPGKADLVTNDVEAFYKTLEDLSKTDGLTQQEGNRYTYQKDVETMQMALVLLGYELPRFGVDGKFGPETAAAVELFKSTNLKGGTTIQESSAQLRADLKSLGYSEKSGQLTSAGEITDDISNIVSDILKDFKMTNPNVKVTITSGNDYFHKKLGYNSKHKTGNAVDLTLSPLNSETKKAFINILNLYKNKNSKFHFINEYDNPTAASTGGHFHLQYGEKGKSGGTITKSVATPEMLLALYNAIKLRGVKPEELKTLIDSSKIRTGRIEVKGWQGLVNLVIDNLEGGYYHPDMLRDGRVKDRRFSGSGETMFGLDRMAGNNEATPEGRAFWQYVDTFDARNKWPHMYMAKENPQLAETLRKMAGDYIKPLYENNVKRFLSNESNAIVNNYPPLTFNFVYATWNGEGWFKRFANVLNSAVESGNTDPKSLNDLINQVRSGSGNSLIAQGAPIVAKVSNRLSTDSPSLA
jgi:hypothetical protein